MSERVLPLPLTLDETRVLLVAVEVCMRLDGAALLDQGARLMAEEVIRSREGEGGISRLDQRLAAARARYPILDNLRSALSEHAQALEKSHESPSEE
jgi:hypothetical protein